MWSRRPNEISSLAAALWRMANIRLTTACAVLLALAMPALAQQSGTPPPATNQCWDNARGELRDKTAPTVANESKETAIGQDQSPGRPAPPSQNAAGSGQPKNPNPVRPPGVSAC